MWLELSVAVSASFVLSKAASNLCLLRLRERQLQPLSHHKSIAITLCWSARLSISWIACNLSSMPLLGCCATGENTTMLHRFSVMFYTSSSPVQDLLAGLQVASWGSAWVSARLL